MKKNEKFSVRMFSMIMAIVMIFALTGCDVPNEDSSVSTEATVETTIQNENTEEPTEVSTEETTVPETEEPTTEPEQTEAPTEEPSEDVSQEPSEETTEPVETTHTHKYTDTVVAPTCTQKGYTKHRCSCGDSYKDTYTNATGHNYKTEVVAPTTSARGYTLHTCKTCGYSYKDNYTDKLVEEEPEETTHTHSYSSKVTAATCTAQGYTTYTCSCGDSYKSNYTDATGHSWGDWTATKEATYTEDGEQKRTCKVCGVAETQVIDKLAADTIDIAALEAYGRSYAAGLGFTIDTSMGKGNSSYYPGLDYYILNTEEGYSCVARCIRADYNTLLAVCRATEEFEDFAELRFRGNVLVEYHGWTERGHKIVVWFFYG